MPPARESALPSSVHVEIFIVPRAKRGLLRERSNRLYRIVRPVTRKKGGVGPLLFLLEPKPRPRTSPQNLRTALDVRADEDLWIELAFYRSPSARRRTLRSVWGDPRIARAAGQVETLNRRRNRSWTVALGRSTTRP